MGTLLKIKPKLFIMILLIIAPLFSRSQVKVLETLEDDIVLKDSLYVDGKLDLKINEERSVITIVSFQLSTEMEFMDEFKIETICRKRDKIMIKSNVLLEYVDPITIAINEELKLVRIEFDEVSYEYSGEGVSIILPYESSFKRCTTGDN